MVPDVSIDELAGRVVASITIEGDASPRVELTPAASVLLTTLWAEHGPLIFHQSGGCCDGSAPMCYPAGEFATSAADVLLGELDLGSGRVVPFWMSVEQFRYCGTRTSRSTSSPGAGAASRSRRPRAFASSSARGSWRSEPRHLRARRAPPQGGVPRLPHEKTRRPVVWQCRHLYGATSL